MNRKSAFAGLAVLGAGALVLTACAGGGTPTETEKPTQEMLPLVGYEQVPYSDLVEGGTLNIAVLGTPTDEGSWNVNHAGAQNVDVQAVLAPTVGTPARSGADGAWEVDPSYATSIELTSESPQQITVKLNEKAVWEDGSPIVAEDYKATYAALAGSQNGYEVIPSSVFDAITNVEVVSDYEFVVTFGEIYADWPSLMLTPALPAAIASDPERFNTEFTSKPTPSSGPFVFDSIDNNAKIFTLVPNPKWWGEYAPKLDSITFRVIAQESLPQAFANDEIDYIEIQTPDALQIAEGKDGAVIQRSGGLTWAHVTFNGLAAPFDDVNVRRAVASAIDRELISRVANEALGAPATTQGDWIFMPGQDGYADTFGETYPLDLDAAAKYLETAGYVHDEDAGEWTKDGKALTFSVLVPAGTQSNINRALGVQDSLAKLDVAVTLDEVSSAEYFDIINNGQYQAVTFGWSGTLFPISAAEPVFYPAMEYGDQNGYNYAFISDDRLGPLWDKANAELDQDARNALALEINKVMADFIPVVPIYPYPEVVATDAGLANFGTATFLSTDYSLIGYTK